MFNDSRVLTREEKLELDRAGIEKYLLHSKATRQALRSHSLTRPCVTTNTPKIKKSFYIHLHHGENIEKFLRLRVTKEF